MRSLRGTCSHSSRDTAHDTLSLTMRLKNAMACLFETLSKFSSHARSFGFRTPFRPLGKASAKRFRGLRFLFHMDYLLSHSHMEGTHIGGEANKLFEELKMGVGGDWLEPHEIPNKPIVSATQRALHPSKKDTYSRSALYMKAAQAAGMQPGGHHRHFDDMPVATNEEKMEEIAFLAVICVVFYVVYEKTKRPIIVKHSASHTN